MERYNKIQKRKLKYSYGIQNFKKENKEKKNEKYLKNKKYIKKTKFSKINLDLEFKLCKCKWAYKYNYHDDGCKYKDIKLLNNNSLIKKKNIYTDVLYN